MWLLALLAGMIAAAGLVWWLRVRWVDRELGPGPAPGLRRAGDEPPRDGMDILPRQPPNDPGPF